MSGIGGIINLNGAPVDPDLLHKMADAMKYRAVDGTKIWCDGSVGFVHCHFWTTPEDEGEEQPISAANGRYWITADARIDNRSELIPFLTAKGLLPRRIPTDAEIILAAYELWSEACPEHIIGDWAFAVWDAPLRRFFAARDVIGIRQLFYAHIDQTIFFGTTIRAVLTALPHKPES